MDSREKPPEPEPAGKKPYAKPKLEIYGNVAYLTQTAAPGGNPDAIPHPNKIHTRP
ncbi:MAG: hypothetical protein Q7S58_08715 [Candidatus Binatus sp.]|uniref:hypothetical protein n=1 Tax=Candidatus Binatus sp. TaxID=2811406 RepID=UPI002720EAC6|nr:hypothetical protein [Candidatus Binatus sp.]MDO8432475.1 hypothetical protein [Candidatus Binatus sp.]